jgi:hypothetical protein
MNLTPKGSLNFNSNSIPNLEKSQYEKLFLIQFTVENILFDFFRLWEDIFWTVWNSSQFENSFKSDTTQFIGPVHQPLQVPDARRLPPLAACAVLSAPG